MANPEAAADKLRRRMMNPLWMKLFFLAKLPLALVAGLKVRELSRERCAASVPYGWRSTNPFKSTYFAAQAMAAEMSTGALVLLATADVPFSTLIVDMTATFGKKATGLATFVCEEGPAIFDAVQQAKATGEPRVLTVQTVGRMADGTEVSRFTFTWSIKTRTKR